MFRLGRGGPAEILSGSNSLHHHPITDRDAVDKPEGISRPIGFLPRPAVSGQLDKTWAKAA